MKYSPEGAITPLGTVFKSNSQLASSRDMVHFTGVTALGQAFTSSSILKLFCPPNLIKTTDILPFELGAASSRINVFLPYSFNNFNGANQFRYRYGTFICLNPHPSPTTSNNPASNAYSSVLYVPDDSVSYYQEAVQWNYFKTIKGISTLPSDLAEELEWYEQFCDTD